VSTFHAFSDRRGVIEFDSCIASGCLPIAAHPDLTLLREIVEVLARHAYDGHTLLVPGIPEAKTSHQAVNALLAFGARVAEALARQAEVEP